MLFRSNFPITYLSEWNMSKSKKNGVNGHDAKPTIPIPEFLRDAIGARLDDVRGRESFPVLYEALVPKFDGPKQLTAPGKLTVQVVGAHWLCKVDLPTYVLQAQVASASLLTCMSDLEAYIAQGGVFSPGFARNKKRLPTIDDAVQ